MNWIWSIGMKFWLGLLFIPALLVLSFIPIIGQVAGLAGMVLFGVKGNEWAWQHRRWDSIQQFRDTQRVWVYWGIGLFILSIVLGVVLGAMMASIFMRNPQLMQPGAMPPGTFPGQ
jgi:hypothetical protein